MKSALIKWIKPDEYYLVDLEAAVLRKVSLREVQRMCPGFIPKLRASDKNIVTSDADGNR